MTYQVQAFYRVEYSYDTHSYTHFRDEPTHYSVWADGRQILRASLTSNKTTGEKNEAGLKRYAKFLRKAAKEGAIVERQDVNAVNQYDDLQQFHAAIGIEA